MLRRVRAGTRTLCVDGTVQQQSKSQVAGPPPPHTIYTYAKPAPLLGGYGIMDLWLAEEAHHYVDLSIFIHTV